MCLLAASCSTVTTQEATRALPESTDEPGASAEQADQNEAPASDRAATQGDPAETSATDPSAGETATGETSTDAASSGADRGGRNLGDDPEALDVPNADDPTEAPEATATAEPATEPEPTEATQETATPIPTTAPLPTVAPLATASPVVAAEPTATPIPEPVAVEQVPAGPLPSDAIVVEGPTVDESLPVGISNNGASACASAESAIEFLDFGDTGRMAGALAEAAQFASQAAEPELLSLAPELAAAGTNEEAAISVIIATLGACAVYGYQV